MGGGGVNFETTDLKHENEQHKFKPSTLNIKINDFPSIIKPLNKTDWHNIRLGGRVKVHVHIAP